MASQWGKAAAAFVGWVAGAISASAVGLFALSAIEIGPVNQTSVPDLPAATADSTGGVSATPTATHKPSSGAAVDRLLNSAGGNVVARCSAEGAYLVSWSPAQGYKAEDVRRGPAAAAKVSFEYHDGGQYEVTVRCVNGVPQAAVKRER